MTKQNKKSLREKINNIKELSEMPYVEEFHGSIVTAEEAIEIIKELEAIIDAIVKYNSGDFSKYSEEELIELVNNP